MVSIEVNTGDVQKVFGRIRADMVPALAAAVLRSAHLAAGTLAEVVVSRFPSGTNQLARSFPANVGFVQRTAGEVSARTFSPLPHARIQDQGGTIRPRTAKALAVPLTSEAKSRWPRDWPAKQLRLIVLRGKALLVEVLGKGKSARIKTHYVLKDQVTITGQHYVDEAKKRAIPKADQEVRNAIAALMRGGQR